MTDKKPENLKRRGFLLAAGVGGAGAVAAVFRRGLRGIGHGCGRFRRKFLIFRALRDARNLRLLRI